MTRSSTRHMSWMLRALLCAVLALTAPVEAAKGGNGGGGGKGSGGGEGGGSGGGAVTPVRITFADEMGALGYRISGDGLGPYDHDPEGTGVEAYLGSGGATGDIFLRLGNAPGRGLWFDFGGCHPDPGSCAPPFPLGVDLASALAVAPGDVVENGLFGMAPGQTIEAPMEFTYDFDGSEGPGFVYFDRGLRGKNPCRNKSLHATVTRPSAADAWTVSADASTLACATLPGGALSGQYEMRFAFTVELAP